MTTDEYLYQTSETTQRTELRYGTVVREPPAPFYSHQQLVLRVARLLAEHVETKGLGTVAIAPLDVILDHDKALVVQPDVLFVSAERLSIIRDQIWGAPDLVVEVLSSSTEAHDRSQKAAWYRQYGVREYWLVDLYRQRVVVMDFTAGMPERRVADGIGLIRSTVLPEFEKTAFALFM